MTLATKITLIRILLVPFFVTQVIYYVAEGREAHRFAALAIFIAAALTDALDGYVARRYNQHSELGVFMDPLADKILLLSGVIVLSYDNTPFFEQLPLWMTATIISREAILVLGIGVIYYFCGKVTIAPRLLSKIATALQMAVILWVLLQWQSDWLEWLCIATAVTTGVAGILYIFDGIKQLGASPSSAATPRE